MMARKPFEHIRAFIGARMALYKMAGDMISCFLIAGDSG